MKNHNIKLKLLGILAVLGLSFTGAVSVAAWGPERTTFTMNQPATYPTFNSITDNPSIGDERDFVRVGQINADVTNLSNEIEILPGHQYLVYIYFHNNASATFNDSAHNNSGVAMQTRMSSSFSTVVTPQDSGKITATITANNTNPASVWDEAYMTTKNDKILLHYVPGSAKIYNDWQANGSVMPSSLFTEEGTLIGLNALNGVIPGCEEYHGIVSYVLQADELNGSIEKQVSKDGTNFAESVNIAPGEEATYRLAIRNTGDVALTNAVVKDQLPDGLALVPGSVKLTANSSTEPDVLPDDIFTNGFNLGTIGSGNTVYVYYTVRSTAEPTDCNSIELTNLASLTYDSEQSSGETKTASTTITVTKEGCAPPAEDLENCTTNPALPECAEENPEETCATNPNLPGCQEMPNTGPREIAIAAVVIAGIGSGGYYLYHTKSKLRTVEQGVMAGTGASTGAGKKSKSRTPILRKFKKSRPTHKSHHSTTHSTQSDSTPKSPQN